MPGERIGGQRGRLPWGGAQRLAAALQRDHGDAGQALKIQSDLGVGAHRRVGGYGDCRRHAIGVAGIEFKSGYFADANAVEQNRRAGQQARYRIFEGNPVGRPLGQAPGVVQPVDKAKACSNHGKDEPADQNIGCPDFHGCLSGSLPRGSVRGRCENKI